MTLQESFQTQKVLHVSRARVRLAVVLMMVDDVRRQASSETSVYAGLLISRHAYQGDRSTLSLRIDILIGKPRKLGAKLQADCPADKLV